VLAITNNDILLLLFLVINKNCVHFFKMKMNLSKKHFTAKRRLFSCVYYHNSIGRCSEAINKKDRYIIKKFCKKVISL